MSRCFPYPPPGYVRNGIRDEALVKSIKREVEKAKKERREERKREKKEKKKAQENGETKERKHDHKRRNEDERIQDNGKGGDHQKKRNHGMEHFEKSSLTEEHGNPVNSQNSSDSTLSSNKKQKHSLPPDSGSNPASIIRIRLPLQRHKDPEVQPSEEQPCSAPVRMGVSAREKSEHAPRSSKDLREQPCSTSSRSGKDSALLLDTEEQLASSGVVETSARKDGISSKPGSDRCGLSSSELKFRDLIENWVPPTEHSWCSDLDDQEWFFEGKPRLSCDSKQCKGDYGVLTSGSPNMWPQARYLPEVDIYALPYTVPY